MNKTNRDEVERKLGQCQIELESKRSAEKKVKDGLYDLCQSAIIANNRLLACKLFDLYNCLRDGMDTRYLHLDKQIELQFNY